MAVEWITRGEWGSTGARGGSSLTFPLDHVIIHTWGGKSSGVVDSMEKGAARMRAVQRSHRDRRGFSDIGYSFCVDASGRVYEGRGWGQSGAHTVGANRLGHAIGMMGHGDHQPATPAQWVAAREIIRVGVTQGAITEDYRISGHRDWPTNKSCPGNLIYPHIHTKLDVGTEFMMADDDGLAEVEGLRIGDQGPAVEHLQRLLNRHSAGLVVDGVFGPKTEDQLRNYQTHEGLRVTLIADRPTMTLLDPPAEYDFSPLLARVELLELHLKDGSTKARQAALEIATVSEHLTDVFTAVGEVRAAITELRDRDETPS